MRFTIHGPEDEPIEQDIPNEKAFALVPGDRVELAGEEFMVKSVNLQMDGAIGEDHGDLRLVRPLKVASPEDQLVDMAIAVFTGMVRVAEIEARLEPDRIVKTFVVEDVRDKAAVAETEEGALERMLEHCETRLQALRAAGDQG